MTNESRRIDRVVTFAGERHAGALAATAWLAARGLRAPDPARWEVALALDVIDGPASPTVTSPDDSRFHIAIAPSEWGFFFCHRRQVSWIRVTDVPFVNERDELELLSHVPPLRELGSLVRKLEEQCQLRFRRDHVSIRTNLPDADATIRSWVSGSI